MAIRYAVYAESGGAWTNIYGDGRSWTRKETARKHFESFVFACPGYDAEIRKIEVISEIEKLRADREKLVEALRFYAEISTTSQTEDRLMVRDGFNGDFYPIQEKARATLKELGEME